MLSRNYHNKRSKVYRTDCRAPIIRSEKEYTEWSKTKNLVFKLTDYGSGGAQTSLLDQVSYKKAELVDGYYNAKYTFDTSNRTPYEPANTEIVTINPTLIIKMYDVGFGEA